MTDNDNTTGTPKSSVLTTIGSFYKRNERRILITTTILSTGSAVLMRSGIASHNEFLKEKGLYDEFYNVLAEDVL